jgi:electron transfer flavoprotein beta subunit
LVIAGKESIDYNGGAVPGMVAQIINQPLLTLRRFEVNGSEATAVREIEGGKETISVKLPAVIAGQKDW